MNNRDSRLEALLRQGPPEEASYVPPPLADALLPHPASLTTPVGRVRLTSPRVPVSGWIALAAVLVLSVIGASVVLDHSARPPAAATPVTAGQPTPGAPSTTVAPSGPAPSPSPSASGALPPFRPVAP